MTAVAIVLGITVLVAAVGFAVRKGRFGRWGRNSASDLSAPTVWSNRRHLPCRDPGVLEATIALGTVDGRLVTADPTTPVMVIGATGSAKTTAIVIPSILEWHGSVVSTSVKADVLEATGGWRATCGDVAVFDPADSLPNSLGHLARPWTPLAAARTWPEASRISTALVAAALDQPGGDRFWAQQAQLLLAGLLYLTATQPDGTMRQVIERLATLTDGAGFTRLAADIADAADSGGPHADLATLAVAPIAAYPPNTAGSVVATVQAALGVYLQGAAANVRVDHPDLIRPEHLLDATGTLYLVGPPREQALYRPLYTALVSHIVAAAYSHAARQPTRQLRHPLLLSLDEVANIAPLPELPTVASTCRSFRIQLLTVLQDLAQLDAAYGPAGAATILSNHASVAVLPRIKDLGTLSWAETILGDTEITRTTTSIGRTSGRQLDGDRSSHNSAVTRTENHTTERVALASKARIAAMPDGEILAVIAAQRAQLTQRRFFNDPTLLLRSAMPLTTTGRQRPRAFERRADQR